MFTDTDAGRYLFHYTTSEVFLTYVLPTMRLRMSSFDRLNDPRESKNWLCSLSIPDGARQDWDLLALSEQFTRQMKGSAKLLCFTSDDPGLDPGRLEYLYGRGYAHPSMWDRYAGHHSGVCLAFDTARLAEDITDAVGSRGELVSMPVSYENMPRSDVDAFHLDAEKLDREGVEQTLRAHQRDHASSLFFYKSRDWEAEFEFRWVLLEDNGRDEPYVDVRRSLRGVIFGDAFPSHAVPMVARIIEGSGILLARMHYRNGDPIIIPT
jgi:hypothetical protein